MTLAKPIHRLTEAEYLDLERNLEARNEFFDGEVFAMSGGTPLHSQIATSLARELGNKLKGRGCILYNSDLRLKVEATGLFTYPDLSVVCGPLQFAPGTDDTVVNPTLIIEVLSDSTDAYDRGKKFENYRRMPALREYLLVSQKEPRIEQFVRQENEQWLLREGAGWEAKLVLQLLGLKGELGEVCAGVGFEEPRVRALVRVGD